ncbi:MAG: UvrD-helicase domain-containing protein [Hyphomicrobiales bacterium]
MTDMGPISVVSAGAGTGKTWRLSTEYVNAAQSGVSPARIIATTFTIKAAAELVERVRARLIQESYPDAAQSALAGLVGTVNSVCGRLVSDFAIDGGLSPVAEVIPPEMADSLFSLATEEAIQKFSPKIDPIAERLRQDDWRKTVLDIVNLARGSGLAPSQFADFALKSWQGIEPLLAPVAANETPADLDRALFDAIGNCISQIDAGGDMTKTTKDTLTTLRQIASQMSNGRSLAWDAWARVSKLKAAKASEPFLQTVRAIAARHPTHPRLHTDLREFIDLAFSCAADALDHFSEFKRARGLLDFTDQEELALELLRQPEVRARMHERFDLLMVDEFQDTSPIQLAVFLEMAKAVKRSLWVGDQKQAIFGFRQTDPALVNAVIDKIRPATGGTEESLDTSRRSRPSLVRFANAVFGAAFPPKGVPADKVVIPNFHRPEPADFGPGLHHWKLEGKNWSSALQALGGRIQAMLASPDTTPVVNRADGATRPLKPSDIAILCRQNERCKAVADVLGTLGIPAAMPRNGLLDTPEAVLACAALRYLVDPADSLAVAELAHFNEGNGDWLNVWLTKGADVLKAQCEAVVALDEQRVNLAHLTPAEALETAIAAARIDQLVHRWDRAGERLANLDALRKVALLYEDGCRATRGAATAAGLVANFAKGLKNGGERPAFEGDDAVRVLTYHRAKGLEWPVVILLDLQDGAKRSPFGAYSESPAEGLDPWNPLAGRWIRFWPWPYGDQLKDVHLDATASASPQAQARTEAELAELVRLLYVGITRARDYLVFATRPAAQSAWLDILTRADGTPVLTLPASDGETQVHVDGEAFTMVVQTADPTLAAPVQDEAPAVAWFAPLPLSGEQPKYPPARLSPSAASQDSNENGTPIAGTPIEIGQRLPVSGNPDMRLLGEAVHGFMAADNIDRPIAEREAMAKALLDRWGVGGAVLPVSLIEASKRLNRFIADRWPEARRHHELPVTSRIGDQRAVGRIDLLLETTEGFVIIDHKSFPGAPDTWIEKAKDFSPQLALYSQIIAQATGRPVLHSFVHMPIVGAVVRLDGKS